MLDKIIGFSVRNKLIIMLFVMGLIAWGIYALKRLPIDALPDITNNQVQIITTAPSQAAQDIERLVTFPVEQAVASIPGITEVRSFSRFGLSVVTVVFTENIDVYWARQQVSERLSAVREQIPAGVGSPELAPVTTGLGEIYQYVIHTKPGYEDKYNAMELRSIQDWIIRRQLLGVPGVADVSGFGGYLKQYEIALDPEKLRSMNLSITDVFTALEKNNQNTGGAYIDKRPNAWFIRSEGLISSLEDIGKVVVKTHSSGIPVLIDNVGKVGYGHAIRYGALTRNDEGERVGALVLMLKGANSSVVIRNVKERIAQIEKTLPEGVLIEPFLDRTKLVNNAIDTVVRNLAEGALIVIFVLVLLLGNLRAGLIVASVIPLAMLFAVCMMNLFNVSGNLMSLGAIDFGLIVDGAVIIVEATMHHLGWRSNGRPLNQQQMDDEVHIAASRMRKSAAFGEIIILIVYLPILALAGVEGKMFRPMAQTVAFAIAGAFILSLTYVPMASALFLSKKPVTRKNFSDRLMEPLYRIYARILGRILFFKRTVILIAVLLFAGSVWMFTRLGAEFIPSLDEGDFAVEVRLLTGSSLHETIDIAGKAAGILMKQFPDEVKEVVGKIGSGEIPTDPMPVEACDLIVSLKDRSSWTKADNKDDLAEKMTTALEAVPGVSFGFQQPIQMRFNELMTGARQDVVVKVYGEDLDRLVTYAGKIGNVVSGIRGATDLYVEQVSGLPQIVVQYHRDQIARFGLNIEDINTVINTAFAGQRAGIVYEGERRFDLVVRLDKQNRAALEDVSSLYITAPDGNQVPLNQVADVSLKIGPNQIQRDDAKRRITVGFNVRGRDVESIVEELQQQIGREVKMSPGYYVTYGGAFENLQQARSRLKIAVPVALLLIFILLYFSFGSLKQGLLIYTAIPLSAVGGIIALWLRDMPFSISAAVGFIALFGVAVLNGIVLIAEFNYLQEKGMANLREIVLTGTRTRLRPVIMTATVASLGFLPMALSHGSGAEVQKPLATVVIGGLITATLLTLLVLPCLYIMSEKFKLHMIFDKKLMTVLLLLGVPLLSKGQQAVTLDELVQAGLQQNKGVQAAAANVDYYRQVRKTAGELPKTDVSLMYGQYNSYVKSDNNVTIIQKLPFPTVFGARAALYDAQLEGSRLQQAVTKHELVYQIRQYWYELQYLYAYGRLIQQQDSVYQRFVKAADLKFRTGESGILEKTSAETRLAEIRHIGRQLGAEEQVLLAALQGLTGSSSPLVITRDSLQALPVPSPGDSGRLRRYPTLQWQQQQVVIQEKERKLEASALLPDLSVGYFNQTLSGTLLNGTGTTLAGSGDRFQGWHAGIAVPLWFGPLKARVRAAEQRRKEADLNYQQTGINLTSRWQQAVASFSRYQSSLDYYRETAIPNTLLMEKQALLGYEKGDISYTTYLLSLQEVFNIREAYLQTIRAYNSAVLSLEMLNVQ
ncbi:CusA/CzcA family heavy metal efflux RND transporter [Chitinophaga rhizophila]|uniref:CusA/CzcA family heavy metal efflux RND transporter n=1 Tax=Chitinophaga rhizophila TaxID=2866212 RepID=A0ABS7G7F3_9BACT|nr:CusA/CzcA family heavy metal efflux RND transporter [Chitinophaga rhizophila]MBW8682724.1 CusA/CzcA family heavy metal efflux RND transporter [Chitinophaga rhizophila]